MFFSTNPSALLNLVRLLLALSLLTAQGIILAASIMSDSISEKEIVPRTLFNAVADPKANPVKYRKGLAVIADFADNRLENWQGNGINSVKTLSNQLRKMESHWWWLSRGLEKFHWDIIRVTLPVNLQPDAYANWVDYRNAVAILIKEQINIADYDSNGDGVVDSAWIIASNNGKVLPYVIGGASKNEGVNVFVDGQESGSVVAGATGNFNHELAHTLGIPDLYGKYDTIHYLTLMSDSWPVPPQDFSAYERTLLGWVKPVVIKHARRGILFPPPNQKNQQIKAVKIPTANASEYFLIERRQRPHKGFGSNAPYYSGLAVYHILETSNQSIDPPLIKLEPADGYIEPGAIPQPSELFYPTNPNQLKPTVFHTYHGSGQPVFQVDNVKWAENGNLALDVTVFPTTITQTNLINSSFETGNGLMPDAWYTNAWTANSTFSWDTTIAKQGAHSVNISSSAPNDAMWLQSVTNLDPNKSYEFCGWLRGQDIVVGPDAGVGANVSVFGGFVLSKSLSGSFDWTQVCVTFKPEENNAILSCRLGFFSSVVTGKLWCDEMTLDSVNSAF